MPPAVQGSSAAFSPGGAIRTRRRNRQAAVDERHDDHVVPCAGIGPSGGDSQVYVAADDGTLYAFGMPAER